jgi:hypothetical protein
MFERMKMTPHEILHCLGFDVPPEGVEMSAKETCLYVESLRALGVTMDVSAIPESALTIVYTESVRLIAEAFDVSAIPGSLLDDCHAGFAKLVLACQNAELGEDWRLDSDVADWLRMLVASNLSIMYRRHKTGAIPSAVDLLPHLPQTVADWYSFTTKSVKGSIK